MVSRKHMTFSNGETNGAHHFVWFIWGNGNEGRDCISDYKTAKAIIGAWSHMNSPNYHDQQYLRYDDATGLFRSVDSATPAADAARAQADSDIATGDDVAVMAANRLTGAALADAIANTDALNAPISVTVRPQSWASAMPIIIAALENGTPEGKRMAKAELMELAAKLDAQNNSSNNESPKEQMT